MTAHELEYCRFLLQEVKDLYVENEAMSTILDAAKSRAIAVPTDWRVLSVEMTNDRVFRSAVEANHAPHLERLKQALRDERLLAGLMNPFHGEEPGN